MRHAHDFSRIIVEEYSNDVYIYRNNHFLYFCDTLGRNKYYNVEFFYIDFDYIDNFIKQVEYVKSMRISKNVLIIYPIFMYNIFYV